MKDQARHVASLVFVPVLTLTLMCSSAYAQSTPPSGTFGYLIHASYTDPSNKSGFALIGLMTFDGAGNVTGSYTSEPQNTPQPRTGALTGTYTANPDGTGSMNIADDMGTKFTFATVTVDGGQGIQLLVTGCSGGLLVLPNGCSIGGTTQISGIARVVYTGPLQGSYGTEITTSPQGAIGVGATNLDGAGNLTISSMNVFLSGTEGRPSLFTLTDTGTYSLNSDGTGAVTLAAMPGQGAQTFTIVTTDNGSGLMLLQVNRSGDGVSFGTARLQ